MWNFKCRVNQILVNWTLALKGAKQKKTCFFVRILQNSDLYTNHLNFISIPIYDTPTDKLLSNTYRLSIANESCEATKQCFAIRPCNIVINSPIRTFGLVVKTSVNKDTTLQ